MAQIIQMPQRTRTKQSLADGILNQPDSVQTVDVVTQAIAEITASADHIAGLVEQLQTCLDTVELNVDKIDNPVQRMFLLEKNIRLRGSLSAAIAELHREVKKAARTSSGTARGFGLGGAPEMTSPSRFVGLSTIVFLQIFSYPLCAF